MFTRKNTAAAAALVALALGPWAGAQSIVSTGGSMLSAEILPGQRSGDGRVAGLRLEIAPGWKTYWRAPGEAGVPPSFDWAGSDNLAGVEIRWPRPEVFESFGMRTIGYSGEVVLPLEIALEDPGRPLRLALALTAGVCREVCLFEEIRLAAEIPPDALGGSAEIAAARAAVPGRPAAVGPVVCAIRGAGAERRFEAEIGLAAPVSDPLVVLEGPEGVWFHGVETRAAADGLAVDAALAVEEGAWVARDEIRLTLFAEGLAADIRGCAAP